MTWAALPYGSFTTRDAPRPRVGVRLDGPHAGSIFDLTAAAYTLLPDHAALFAGGTLDPLLGATTSIAMPPSTMRPIWAGCSAPGRAR